MGRILVTGGAGFIGSHVVENLLSLGFSPVVLDNLKSGKLSNLAHLSGYEFVHGDMSSVAELRELTANVQAVVHLAAEPSVAVSVSNPIETHQANYVTTLNLLEAIKDRPELRVIYASSAAVYASEETEPHHEQELPAPSSPYGLDKLSGEHALAIYRGLHGLSSTALRFFNIYGERQDPSSPYSGVISIFVSRLMAGQSISIFGDGEQCRDFVYVRDLASLICRLVSRPDAPALMNVGTGRSVTLKELVATLETVLNLKADVRFLEPRAGDIRISRADIRRLRSFWDEPFTDLPQGLQRLVASLGSN